MNDDVSDDGRRSLLAAFARAPEKTAEGTSVVAMSPAPVDRIVGAQKVAVYRDEQRVLEKIKVLASAAGTDWYYRFPVKTRGGGQDWIEGASIKLANDVARLYGNCEIDTRVTDLGDSWLIYARFFDAETGFTMTRPFQQRKGQRGMRGEGDRMLDINLQIGASKAIRNVIVNSLQSIADFALEEARNALVQKIGKNIDGWRERCLQRIAERKIELPRIEKVMGRVAKDWTAPDIARVVAMLQSIADGMTTADETFPPIERDESAGSQPSDGPETPADADERRRTEIEANDLGSVAAADEHRVALRAYEAGKIARAAGHARKAMPGELRESGRTREALAWTAGYDGSPLPEFSAQKNTGA